MTTVWHIEVLANVSHGARGGGAESGEWLMEQGEVAHVKADCVAQFCFYDTGEHAVEHSRPPRVMPQPNRSARTTAIGMS